MQVAKLDMTNTSHQCPPGTRFRSSPSKYSVEVTVISQAVLQRYLMFMKLTIGRFVGGSSDTKMLLPMHLEIITNRHLITV